MVKLKKNGEDMIWAQFHSATISIDAFGTTKLEAGTNLQLAWRRYAEEAGQEEAMLSGNWDQVIYQEICPTKQYFLSMPRPVVRRSKPGYEGAAGRIK